MEELQGPVIGIALVLVAVFLPAAFISGITGQLMQQFALTLSVSVSISAFVALSLTPALCTLILTKERGRLWGPVRLAHRPLQRRRSKTITGGYVATLSDVLSRTRAGPRASRRSFMLPTRILGLTFPAGFVPTEDQGVVFAQIQLPYGSSLERNETLTKKIERQVLKMPGVQDVVTLEGFTLLEQLRYARHLESGDHAQTLGRTKARTWGCALSSCGSTRS